MRGLLVSAELALALVLLVGAGLLIRTFIALSQVDLGLEPHNVLTMRIALLGSKYQERSRQTEFFRQLLQKLGSLPGVTSAAVIDGGGLAPDGGNGDAFMIVGRPVPPPSELPDAVFRVISPDYFRTMGIPLLRGRYFTEADNQEAPGAAIISEKLARNFWPGGEPIGSELTFPTLEVAVPGVAARRLKRFAIVGIVKAVKNRGLEVEAEEEVYVPYSQYPTFYSPRTLVARTSVEPTLLVSAIRHEVTMLDNDQPISEIRTMDQVVAQAAAGHRFPMVLLGLFAALALALAGVGIYGVTSYSVGRRAHEIGIRVALGARRAHVLRLVLSGSMRWVLAGLALGISGSLGLTRLLRDLLYGVRPTDPLVLGAVSLLLSSVALVASYIPARRATKVDPMAALRCE